MLKFYLFIASFVIVSVSVAQKRVLQGYLQDSITHFAIPNGKIVNGTLNLTTQSNALGRFSLEASPNDFIYAVADGYHFDTLNFSILFTDTITVYLSPIGNVLAAVTVTTRFSKYQLDSIRRREDFERNRGTHQKTISSANNSGFGIGLNLDKLFKSRERDRRSYEKRYPEREKAAYIDFRFNPYIVAHYTGLKGEPLRGFIYRNTPTYEWLRKHTSNEDILYYINDKLKLERNQKVK